MRVATFLDLNQTLDRLILKTSFSQRTDSKLDLSSDQTFLVHAQLPPCLYAPLLASLKPLTIQVLSLSRTEKGSIKMICTAPVGGENISLLLAQALLDHLKTNSISSASETFLKTLKSYPEKFINAKTIDGPLVGLPNEQEVSDLMDAAPPVYPNNYQPIVIASRSSHCIPLLKLLFDMWKGPALNLHGFKYVPEINESLAKVFTNFEIGKEGWQHSIKVMTEVDDGGWYIMIVGGMDIYSNLRKMIDDYLDLRWKVIQHEVADLKVTREDLELGLMIAINPDRSFEQVAHVFHKTEIAGLKNSEESTTLEVLTSLFSPPPIETTTLLLNDQHLHLVATILEHISNQDLVLTDARMTKIGPSQVKQLFSNEKMISLFSGIPLMALCIQGGMAVEKMNRLTNHFTQRLSGIATPENLSMANVHCKLLFSLGTTLELEYSIKDGRGVRELKHCYEHKPSQHQRIVQELPRRSYKPKLLSLALVSQPELSTVDNQLVWSRILSKFLHEHSKGRIHDDYSVIACRLVYASTQFAARWYSHGTLKEQLQIQQKMTQGPVLLLALQRNNAIEHAHDIYESLDSIERKSVLYSGHQDEAHAQIALSFTELNSDHFRVKTILNKS